MKITRDILRDTSGYSLPTFAKEPLSERDCVVLDQSQRSGKNKKHQHTAGLAVSSQSLLPTRCDWSRTTQSRSGFSRGVPAAVFRLPRRSNAKAGLSRRSNAKAGLPRRSFKAKAGRSEVAFTMIEIAICLAVIGFALAAIIGVLPLGMSVQKENREETIIHQDGNLLLNAIRNGELGVDDLTNYVLAITNFVTEYDNIGKPRSFNYGYIYDKSFQNGASMSPAMGISNGFRIIGLLSTPRYTPMVTRQTSGIRSNYVVAYVRALSGNASEKFPQTNSQLQDLAFSYRMISDIVPYSEFDRSWTNFMEVPSGNTNEFTQRSNYWLLVKTMQANLHDVRLIFRFPYLPNGKTGNGRIVFRTSASGHLSMTNDMGLLNPAPPYQLYFFEPRNYMRVTANVTP